MKKELLILSIFMIIILLIIVFFYGFDKDIIILTVSLVVVILFVATIDKKKVTEKKMKVEKRQEVSFKDFRKIVILVLRIVVSAVIIFSSYFITYRLWHGWISLSFIFFIVVAISISSILIKSNRLSYSIIIGITTGVLSGTFFFLYHYRIALSTSIENPSEYVDWGFLYAISIWFTLVWIISCITGAVISYFIRRELKNRVKLDF